jgi:ElaA protein
MMDISWVFKKFDDLSNIELYAILKLRNEVFVVEQNCVYQDADGKDTQCYHFCGWMNNNLIAYTRILPAGLSFEKVSIGRVVTAPKSRGNGLGKILMQKSIEHTLLTFNCKQIKIGAQQYLLQFYEALGFVPCSAAYLEDGIPHVDMILTLSQ